MPDLPEAERVQPRKEREAANDCVQDAGLRERTVRGVVPDDEAA
jgi:hypothetical protein